MIKLGSTEDVVVVIVVVLLEDVVGVRSSLVEDVLGMITCEHGGGGV